MHYHLSCNFECSGFTFIMSKERDLENLDVEDEEGKESNKKHMKNRNHCRPRF